MEGLNRVDGLLAFLATVGEVESIDKLHALVYLWQKLNQEPDFYRYLVDFIGPYSAELRKDIFLLIELGLVEDSMGPNTVRLTEKGRQFVEDRHLKEQYSTMLKILERNRRGTLFNLSGGC